MKENIYFFLLCLIIALAFGWALVDSIDRYFDRQCLEGNISGDVCPEELFEIKEAP